jgi:starch phosphorylase
VQVYLNDLALNAARVELYADGVNGGGPVRQEMQRITPLAGTASACIYRAQVPASRRPTDYTARVTPHCDGVAIPLEETSIIWQR